MELAPIIPMGNMDIHFATIALGHFVVARKDHALETIHNGYINDTYLVMDAHRPKYILQRVNQNVFKDIDGLMGNIDHALDSLRDPGYERIELIKTHSGSTYFEDANGYWRLMTYIEESTAHNTTTDPKVAYEAGRIIGKFHQLLGESVLDDYVDTIPQFHDLDLRKLQFEEACSTAQAEKMEIARDTVGFAQTVLDRLAVLSNAVLPLRICHNDTKLNNILFSKKEDTALCLIDLDTLMKGYFYYDFGDAVRTIANVAPEDEQDHSKITFERPLFESFIDGLAFNGPFLTREEIKALPLGAVFMPFIHGLRALTDYLNNNIYYKVAYENQNLDRCLSLFHFTQKTLDELPYM